MRSPINVHREPSVEDIRNEAVWRIQSAGSNREHMTDALEAWAAVEQAVALQRIATALEQGSKG